MIALPRFAVAVTVVASLAAAAPSMVAVMPVEAPDAEATGREVHTALVAGVAGNGNLVESGPVGMGLDEARMAFSCFDESAACMAQVGGLLQAERLLWAKIKRGATGWEMTLRHLDVAAGKFLRREQVSVAAGPAAQGQLVKAAEAFALDAPLPKSTIANLTVESRPAGAVVRLDGEEVGTTPLIISTRHGEHRVEVDAPGMARAIKDIDLSADDTVRLQLVPLGDTSRPPGEERSTGFWLGVSTGALAVTALGVSAFYGVETLRLRQKVQDDLTQDTHERVQPDFDEAKLITNVGWGVAAVSAGLSAYFFLLHDDVTASIGVRPGGAVVRATF